MKQILLGSLLLALTLASGCRTCCDTPSAANALVIARPRTFSSLDLASGTNAPIAARSIRFVEADIKQVLDLYQVLSGRTLIRSPQVSMTAKITFENEATMTAVEALQALDTTFAGQGIVMINVGSQYVKVVPTTVAATEPSPVFEGPWRQLPESSSYLTYIVKLKKTTAEDAISMLSPFAKLPNSIIAFKGSNVLILRDYSSNVRRMMEVLERIEADSNRTANRP